MHPDDLVGRRGQVLSHVVRTNGELSVAAVDQHGEPYGARPAQVENGIERRANRASGIEDVIDKHNDAPVNVDGNGRGLEPPGPPKGDIVPVEADVQSPRGKVGAFERGDRGGNPLGERRAARSYADQHEVVCPPVRFDYLVRHAHEGAPDVVRAKDVRLDGEAGGGLGH